MSNQFEKQWGPAQLRAWMTSVEKAITRNRPINGTSIQVNDSESGKVVNFMPPNPGNDSNGGGGGGNPYPTGGSVENGKLVIAMSSGSNIEIPVVFVTGVSFDGTSIVAQKNDGTTDEIETEECP